MLQWNSGYGRPFTFPHQELWPSQSMVPPCGMNGLVVGYYTPTHNFVVPGEQVPGIGLSASALTLSSPVKYADRLVTGSSVTQFALSEPPPTHTHMPTMGPTMDPNFLILLLCYFEHILRYRNRQLKNAQVVFWLIFMNFSKLLFPTTTTMLKIHIFFNKICSSIRDI